MPGHARTVAIVQARMGSTRLPGKVLRELGGQSVLAAVIHRIRRFRLIDDLVVATTEQADDNQVVREAERLGVAVFRGSEKDVLDRYYQAARAYRAESIVRITSDCPLIDPQISDLTIERFREVGPDYASNTLERTYPRGLDTEVVTFSALERAWREALEPYQRAHVMPYFYQNPDKFWLLSVKDYGDHSGYRWTLDTPADYQFLQAVYKHFEGNMDFTWQDVLRFLDEQPELAEINRNVHQKEMLEG